MHTTVPVEIDGIIGQLIGEVADYLEGTGSRPAGPPYARPTWAPGSGLEVGFPVDAPVAGDGRVVAGELPAGPYAVTTHVGQYDIVRNAHEAVVARVEEQGLQIASVPLEVYVTDPTEVIDPTEWQIQVVYPVR